MRVIHPFNTTPIGHFTALTHSPHTSVI